MTNATGADRAIRAAQVRHFVLVRRRFPKWLRVVWVSVCCLFVVSELVMTPFGLPSISSLLLQWTGEYQPVRWLVGNLTGFVLLYTLALLWRLNVLKWKLARGAGAFVGFLAKVPVWVFDILFYGALATGVVEVLLIATNTGTVSRFFFDWAQGFALLYWIAGLFTGLLLFLALFGTRIALQFRLAAVVLMIVSAHIFWHLEPEAYKSALSSVPIPR